MFRLILKTVCLSALLLTTASAATLQVYPVNIDFSQDEKVKAVYVSNTGDTPINAQIRVFRWQQQGNENTLSETKDIIASPPLTDIPPQQQQLIRVIIPGDVASEGEQAYRLIIDELPGNDNAENNSAVKFLLRYSLPVFIHTPDAPVDPRKTDVRIDNHVKPAMLFIRNNNKKHIKLSDVFIINNGKEQIINKGLMGYVLADSQMQWPLPDNISAGQTLKVTINEQPEPHSLTVYPY